VKERVQEFYAALDRGDGDTMAAMYHPDGRFCDPAFGELTGEQAGRMWRMLTSRGGDLSVSLEEVAEDGSTARWVARYTFTQTGRPVVNDVRARFVWRDGRIASHDDSFSFWTWSRQALGPVGLALGWTPLLRAKVRSGARAQLEKFV
jgi:ketosteroid isomerase-like protein